MSLKAIAFDIDDTLYPDSSLYIPSIPLLLRYSSFLKVYKQVRKQLRVIDYPNPKGEEGFYRVEAEVFKEISRSQDSLEVIQKKIKDFYNDWLQVFQKAKPFPKMKEILFSLSEKGYKIGFMSDLAIANRLEVLGVADIANVAFSSQETGYLKPHKAPFNYLVESFQVEPQEILYVGNSYAYDILGASSCSLKTAHIAKKSFKDSVADFTFFNYSDLEVYIDSLQN